MDEQEIDMGSLVGLKMIYIPGGEFTMGSNAREDSGAYGYAYAYGADDADDDAYAIPAHRVEISPFCISECPITQAQYSTMIGENPSYFQGSNLPVEEVPWDKAAEFCRQLSQLEGRDYRLPTEDEWECACRAGSDGSYCFGDDPAQLGEYAWYADNSGDETHPVGQLKPNAWGLYDMHGNVWEWCQDLYVPAGSRDGKCRVLRGGAWFSDHLSTRAASRYVVNSLARFDFSFGFRVVSDFRLRLF